MRIFSQNKMTSINNIVDIAILNAHIDLNGSVLTSICRTVSPWMGKKKHHKIFKKQCHFKQLLTIDRCKCKLICYDIIKPIIWVWDKSFEDYCYWLLVIVHRSCAKIRFLWQCIQTFHDLRSRWRCFWQHRRCKIRIHRRIIYLRF